MDYRLIDLPSHNDERGGLVALEAWSEWVPFEIKRVYYLFATAQGVERGFHAHRKLQQLCICVSGSCDFVLDNGQSRETVHLNSPLKGLRIGNSVWREMKNFTPDCVILVIASEHYDEADYIRDYQKYLSEINHI